MTTMTKPPVKKPLGIQTTYGKRPGRETTRFVLTESQKKLVEDNITSAYKQAKMKIGSLAKAGIVFDPDMILSATMFGLCEAAPRFDPDKGTRFSTFATQRMRGRIIDDARVFDETKSRYKRDKPHVVSASTCQPQFGSETNYAMPILDEAESDVDKTVEERDAFRALVNKIAYNAEERLVLGLLYEAGVTMREVGDAIGLSETRISQIHTQLIRRAKGVLCGEGVA